jgi:hypothetical protein
LAKELWEIELDLKIDKVNQAQKKYDESLDKIKQSEKRLTAAIMAEEKISTAIKLSEIKIKEKATLLSLDKIKQAEREAAAQKKKIQAELNSSLSKNLLKAGKSEYKLSQEESKAWAQAIIEDKKRTQKADDDYTAKQIANINRIAKARKELEAAIEKSAAQRLRLAANQNVSQQKADSKFTGQSVELGSVAALTQQIAHFRQLRDSVNTNSKDFATYQQKVQQLTAAKKELTGTTNSLTGMVGKFGAGLVSIVAVQQAYNLALNSAKFQVMREAFQGSEKDLQAFRQASANTVSDASLIALSNQASDLNINLKDQAILFAFAEQQADKYNTSTEEGFQKVFAIITGSTKGLKDLGIVKSDFTALTEKLAKEQGKEVDEQIRLQAILTLTNKTYEDAVNNQMDMADTLETVHVQAKNVADEHFNLLDLFSSLNPVTGFLNVGIEDLGKKETKAKDDAMLLIGSLDNFNSKIPGWGAGTEDLRNYFINLAETFLTTANTAGLIQDALSGTSINRKGGDASIPLQGEGKKKIKTSGRTKSGSNNTPEKTLNFLEQFRENVKALENDIKTLNTLMSSADIKEYEKLAIQDQLIAKQRELNELKRINLGLEGILPTGSIPGTPGLVTGIVKATQQNSNQPSPGDEDTENEIARIEELRLSYAQQIDDNFMKMLQSTGIMETQFGKIVNAIRSVFEGISSGVGFIGGIFGFIKTLIPGGGAIPSLPDGAGGGSQGLPNYSMPNQSPLVAPVIIKNPITLGKGLEVENRYNDVRGSIDV